MGRIDEALQRAGKASVLPAAPARTSTEAEVFASPWSFREPAGTDAAPVEERAEARPAAVDAFPGTEVRTVGGLNPQWTERLVSAPHADPLMVEQFRQLAATLHQAQAADNIRVVMITSADAGDGKSLTAVNLALTLSDSYGRRVLLVDADLRRPSLHEMARIPNTHGLGDTLKSSAEQKLPVYRLSDTLMIVPAGQPDRDPMMALTSPRMQQILQEAAARFDWILIDTPPMGPIADSSLLVPIIDAAILVVRAGRTHYADIQRAITSIGRDRILGVVLNAAERGRHGGYRHYYYEADAVPPK